MVVVAGSTSEFVEKRKLPRTYRLVVGGHTATCPTLRGIPRKPHATAVYGLNWFLVPTATGQCALAPLGSPAPG